MTEYVYTEITGTEKIALIKNKIRNFEQTIFDTQVSIDVESASDVPNTAALSTWTQQVGHAVDNVARLREILATLSE
jgi:hypothetical protein